MYRVADHSRADFTMRQTILLSFFGGPSDYVGPTVLSDDLNHLSQKEESCCLFFFFLCCSCLLLTQSLTVEQGF